MPANLENSAVASGLEKISLHSSPKEGQCQRKFKLPYNCSHFTCQQGNTQNPSSYVSAVRQPRNSRYTSYGQKSQRNQRSNCQHPLDHNKKQQIYRKNIYFCFTDYAKPLIVWITTKCGTFLKIWEYQNKSYMPSEKTLCRSRSNSQNNGLV